MSDWFRRPENRGFDLYHAHDGISGNALATLQGRRPDPRLRPHRASHRRFRRPAPRPARRRGAIRAADALVGRQRASGADQLAARLRPRSGGRRQWRRCWRAIRRDRRIGGGLRTRLDLGDGPGVPERSAASRRARTRFAFSKPFAQILRRAARRAPRHRRRREPARSRRLSGGIRCRNLLAMGDGAAAVVRTGPLADADMPALYRLATRLFSPRSRKASVSACWRRWRAERRSSSRASRPSSTISAKTTSCGAIRSTPASIAAAMRAALTKTSPPRRRTCGPAVAARFDWRRVAERHLPVYRRLREPAHA